jgi:four helix bundle protein
MSVLILATKYLLNMHNFKDLKVWQKAIDLAVDVYKVMLLLPADEKFGLVSQMKRCSVSIPSNIAEGSGRGSNPQFKHFLNLSQGSAFELETQLIISNKLELLDDDLTEKLVYQTTEVQKMIYSLERKIN